MHNQNDMPPYPAQPGEFGEDGVRCSEGTTMSFFGRFCAILALGIVLGIVISLAR
jgi:hypothetical protein